MKDAPDGFRTTITVFGERLKALQIFAEEADEPMVLYRNTTQKGTEPRVATVKDWMQWDRKARDTMA